VKRAGHRLRLDPRFRGKHLKRWTLYSSIVTDIWARGVPWTQLIHRYGALANDLNVRWEMRLSVVLSYVLLASILAAPFWPASLVLAVAALAVLIFPEQRLLRVVPAEARVGFCAAGHSGAHHLSPL
jgi:hypothetical protein